MTDFSTSIFSKSLDGQSVAALFVTTTDNFTEGAERYIDIGRWPCPKKIVRGRELLELLQQHLPGARYCIEVPLKDRYMQRNQKLFSELEAEE